jgi:DNA helicase-2/ATP-dependent DNA helicase PcrA
MEAALKKLGAEEQQEMANVNELITAAKEYDEQNAEGSLADYLAQVTLMSDVDQLNDSGGAVTLMTLHTAKGLEFPVVVIMGLEEGCLPHSRARESESEMEEERRLCFVGITRAQQRLLLTKSALRTVRGMRGPTVPSPFLRELPREALELIEHRGGDYFSRARGSGGFDRDEDQSQEHHATRFRNGQMVRHPTFGIGRISEITETGLKTRVEVQFKSAGRKILILEHAHLEPVG